MPSFYVIKCRECGVDCDFETYGETIESVIEKCAEHGRQAHGMRSFTPDLYAGMRRSIRTAEAVPGFRHTPAGQ